jgi:TPR repeat protein
MFCYKCWKEFPDGNDICDKCGTNGDSDRVTRLKIRAEQGDPDAQTHLGWCYDKEGNGTTVNHAKAAEWFRKAAEQGYAAGQNSLGVCYAKGQGVEQDYNEAIKWYRKAAEQCYTDAYYNLGICYDQGNGITKDHDKAIEWLSKAADEGHIHAKETLKKILMQDNQNNNSTGFFDTLSKVAKGAIGVADKAMKSQAKHMSTSQLQQLADNGNKYAVGELQRREK